MVGPPTSTLEPLSPGPVIDPRIRARRIEVRRTEGRRKLQRLVDVGLVLLVATAFAGALFTPLLDVDAVRVLGAGQTGADAVQARAGVQLGDRLISVDVRAVGERVAGLPWVGEVAVRRSVDGTVTVRVTERVPVAAVGAGPSAVLVDRDGRVLGPAAGAPGAAGLPTLMGVGPVPAAGTFLDADQRPMLELAARLEQAVPGAVAALVAEGLTASLVQGGAVRFGDTAQLDAKLRSLRTVLDQVDLRCLAVVDLRLPGSPVLTREERCS